MTEVQAPKVLQLWPDQHLTPKYGPERKHSYHSSANRRAERKAKGQKRSLTLTRYRWALDRWFRYKLGCQALSLPGGQSWKRLLRDTGEFLVVSLTPHDHSPISLQLGSLNSEFHTLNWLKIHSFILQMLFPSHRMSEQKETEKNIPIFLCENGANRTPPG